MEGADGCWRVRKFCLGVEVEGGCVREQVIEDSGSPQGVTGELAPGFGSDGGSSAVGREKGGGGQRRRRGWGSRTRRRGSNNSRRWWVGERRGGERKKGGRGGR